MLERCSDAVRQFGPSTLQREVVIYNTVKLCI